MLGYWGTAMLNLCLVCWVKFYTSGKPPSANHDHPAYKAQIQHYCDHCILSHVECGDKPNQHYSMQVPSQDKLGRLQQEGGTNSSDGVESTGLSVLLPLLSSPAL